MSLTGLLQLLKEDPAYRRLAEDIASGRMAHEIEASDSARPCIIAALWHHRRSPVLAIVPRPEDARRLCDNLLTYLGGEAPVYLLPESEVLPFERQVSDAATNNQRMLALAALLWSQSGTTNGRPGDGGAPALVVASAAAALRKTISPEKLAKAWHTLRVGDAIRLSELFSLWVDLGYQRDDGVEVPGTFSHRGGIVDIYPPSSPLPARIELLGDQIESIRIFDPVSQRSVRTAEQVDIIPASEIVPSLSDEGRVSDLIGEMNFSRCTTSVRELFEEELSSLFSGRKIEELPLYNGLLNQGSLIDHLPMGGLLVLDRVGEIEADVEALAVRAEELRATREARGELPANFPSPQLSWNELRAAAESRVRVTLKGWTGGGEDSPAFQTAPSYYGRPQQMAADLRRMLSDGGAVAVVSRHTGRLSEVLAEEGVGAAVRSDLDSPPPAGTLSLLGGSLREGWTLSLPGGVGTLLTDSELFGTAKERRSRPRGPVKREAFLSELVPGGYVVHVDHGVARFAGTTSMGANGDQKEYLTLEYAESDKLYVPTDHLDRVSPYLGPGDQPPTLTRLGTAEWGRIKERAKESAREMTRELLGLYAARSAVQGHAFGQDSPWQQELEDSFPYEETADQDRTIQEVKHDMEQVRPMDRLVCGDVGYGKTEVALRAAFKTVNEGMQVGLLVPTTVLAQQHYSTFSERLSPFPVRVEVLSRFRTRKEQGQVIEALKTGAVDVVIGTHRLLQKDVSFKNLGLVVVDEEQRFGVAHKERLKQLRTEVDMLTLSATPIPRTLYMGLLGIRDMSTMETPPEERLPVKTYVCEYSDEVIKEAILRELERGGQLFFLHNRVRTIRRVADDLAQLVPQARIAIGHGRMAESDLEKVMLEFTQGEVDMLVCTTIIESGLDIPNANTLIIDRADRFGLSQLYQLRGRVGRSGQRAYSYLLIPPRSRITEAAGKRLKAILEAAELGAGFRIAMRDLEIRGAGNMLGAEQSGHIHAIGFELYAQLLNEAVAEVKAGMGDGGPASEAKPIRRQVRVNLSLSAYIPENYISHLPTRLAAYQRLTRVEHREQVQDIREELRDRFGPLPQVVDNLLYLVDVKLLAGAAGVKSAAQSGSTVTLTLVEAVGGARLALEKALGPAAKVGNRQVHITARQAGDGRREVLGGVLERLLEFTEQLRSTVAMG